MMSRPARHPRIRLASLLVPVVAGVLLGATLGAPAAHAVGANPAPVTVPSLRSWQGGQGSWELTPHTRIVIAPSAVAELRTTAELLAGELDAQEGVRPPIVSGTPSTHDIGLAVGDVPGAAGREAYRLTLESAARLTGASREGVIHGTRTLLQALRTSPRAHSVDRGTATDWPLFGDRGQMLDVGRKYFPVDYLKQQIRQSAWYKLNTFHLHLSDWNGYRIESAKYPEIVAEQHYTKRELRDLEDYAERYGVTVVPEIDLPGHSVAIGNAKPELAFSCASMARPGISWEGSDLGHWTLDYTKPATRAFARDLVAPSPATSSRRSPTSSGRAPTSTSARMKYRRRRHRRRAPNSSPTRRPRGTPTSATRSSNSSTTSTGPYVTTERPPRSGSGGTTSSPPVSPPTNGSWSTSGCRALKAGPRRGTGPSAPRTDPCT